MLEPRKGWFRPNLNQQEKMTLKEIMTFEDIIIFPADKGGV